MGELGCWEARQGHTVTCDMCARAPALSFTLSPPLCKPRLLTRWKRALSDTQSQALYLRRALSLLSVPVIGTQERTIAREEGRAPSESLLSLLHTASPGLIGWGCL